MFVICMRAVPTRLRSDPSHPPTRGHGARERAHSPSKTGVKDALVAHPTVLRCHLANKYFTPINDISGM
jgi:hypothetical protein